MIAPWILAFEVFATTAEPLKEPPACIGELNGPLEREAYAELIEAATRCEATTRHPRNRYFSGIGRLALGQNPQAILDLLQYLRDSAGEPIRLVERAGSRLSQAQAQTGAVVMTVSDGEPDREIRIEVQRLDREESPLSLPLSALATAEDGAALWLDPGRYRVTATDGVNSATHDLDVTAGGDATLVALSLRPRPALLPLKRPPAPPPPAARFPRRVWLAETLVLGTASMVAGLVMVPLGVSHTNRQLAIDTSMCRPGDALARCRDGYAEATTLRGAGAGLLGAGFGAVIGGLTGLGRRDRPRRIAWSVEAGLGATLTVVGAAVLARGLREFNSRNTDAGPDAALWDSRFAPTATSYVRTYSSGAGLLGLGVGLGVTAVVGLVVQRVTSRHVEVRSQGLALRF